MKLSFHPQARSPKAYFMLGAAFVFICFSMGFLISIQMINGVGEKSHSIFRAKMMSVKHFPSLQPNNDVRNKSLVTTVQPRHEALVHEEAFYTSNFSASDTSTTIIFNVFRGEIEALWLQLEAAFNQKNVSPPDIWVMCFNSSKRQSYEAVVNAIRVKYPEQESQLVFTMSEFNHKFHGRFLLAYMATTKYVLIVDDDRSIDSTTVFDYIQYMRRRKGVWGNFGHLRASTFGGYKSWPRIGYNLAVTDMAEQDYLCGMWFLEQTWLEYFMKERPPSWVTSEDMHLSHVMRKYLNLNTYGGKVALYAPRLPRKKFAATTGSALDLREFIFDHQLGRGNKVASVDAPIETLVYVETVGDIEDYLTKLDACPSKNDSSSVNVGDSNRSRPWCDGGKTAAVFRGAKEQDVTGLIAAAEKLCAKTHCEYFSVKPNIRHGIQYFNMHEGYGQAATGIDIPFQTGASDVLLSLVGILNNVLPDTLFVPDVGSISWPETNVAQRNRLQIYHRTVLLAVDIHRNTKTNSKVVDGKVKDELLITDDFPSNMQTLIWQCGSLEDPIQYSS